MRTLDAAGSELIAPRAGTARPWSRGLHASVGYIAEIDGLRAVAVLSVILFHAGLIQLSGGFVGVDVFFVISGYLITRILLAGGPGGAPLPLAEFYARRVLRIAPALFATLAATGVVFFLVLPPVLSGELLGSLASAVLSWSNFWFNATVDYFTNGATNPVLHTWSLAIEEQFYLLLPLALLLLGRSGGARARTWTLAAAAVASLLAAGAVAGVDRNQAFYFPWLRAWELLLGSLLAGARLEAIPHGVKAGLSYAGLASIAASCVLFDDRMVFPGYAALVPCLGAAAVIAGAGGDSAANRALRTGAMRFTGRISYSLYLVHWPVVCLASLLVSLHPFKVKLAVVIASFLIAWASYRWIETPFRALAGKVESARVFSVFAAAGAILLVLFALLQYAGARLWQLEPQALGYSAFLRTDTAFFRAGTCFLSPRHPEVRSFAFDQCLAPAAGRTNVLIIGDSHAANIVEAAAALHPSVQVLQATAAGCTPLLDATAGAPHCGLLDLVYRDWLPKSGAHVGVVVLAARWEQKDIEPLKRTLGWLRGLGKQVVLYGPSPEYFVSVPLILAYEQVVPVRLAPRLLKQDRLALDARFRAEFAAETTYFSPVESLCAAGACVIVDEGKPVFFDRDHFTPSGARLALKGFPLPR